MLGITKTGFTNYARYAYTRICSVYLMVYISATLFGRFGNRKIIPRTAGQQSEFSVHISLSSIAL